jgi:hypothetical protein
MGNTANNNWPYPESTDLVKDGATAIENLADAIDTTLGVYSPATPMGVHLTTVSFSAVSSVSLPTGTFTSTYANYQIVVNANLASSTTLQFRMRLAGTDNTANSYVSQVIYGTGSSAVIGNVTSTTGILTNNNASNLNPTIFNIYEPFVAQRTIVSSNWINLNMTTGLSGIDHNVATAFDSLTLLTGTGNMTGSVSVYGFNK